MVPSRDEFAVVQDGWSVTDIGTYRLHVYFQKTLTDGRVLRGVLHIPKETASDPNTWIGEEESFNPDA